MPLGFAPYAACAGRPHVVADGAPQAGTTLTLSHWPGTPTPPALRADTSAEIALRFLDLPEAERAALLLRADAATNNHFDEDGALALFALLNPAEALARRRLLVEAAEAGDFLVWRDPRALKLALAIAACGRLERGAAPGSSYADEVAARYEAVLPRIGAWLEDPDAPDARALWGPPLEEVRRGQAAFEAGRARIAERPELDLAIVERQEADPLPRLAVYPRTACTRVAWIAAGALEAVSLRYETWVRLVSRRPRPRVDLAPLVPVLDRLEIDVTPGGGVAGRWVAEPVEAITPDLYPAGPDGRRRPSRIPPARVLEALALRLATGDRQGGDFHPDRDARRGV
jgi:hypothetical protein